MSFDRVESAVIDEAKADAGEIIEEARRESEKIKARFREESERNFEEAALQSENASARETARIIGLARQEGKLEVLRAKNQVIDNIFRKTAEKFGSLPEQDRIELITGWLNKLSPEIGGSVRVSPIDAKFFTSEFMASLNSGRPSHGLFSSVTADERISGGFIIEGNNFTVDFTIDTKLKELRESFAGELARELFES